MNGGFINGKMHMSGYPAAYGTKPAVRGQTGNEFSGQVSTKVNAKPKTHIIYMKTDDMLYSGGNGTGLSYYIKYAPESTEEDPTVIAKGVDENGNAFERTIHIHKINPRAATVVEMRALEAYLGVEKNAGFTSLPPETGEMGLYDRRNFMDMFQKQIRDMTVLKEKQLAAYYRYSMQMYQDFLIHAEWHLCPRGYKGIL